MSDMSPYRPQPPVVVPKSAGLAILMSFFVIGLGSMYAGKVGKGVMLLVAAVISAILTTVLIGFVLLPVFWIWGMVAANNDVNEWNRAHGMISG